MNTPIALTKEQIVTIHNEQHNSPSAINEQALQLAITEINKHIQRKPRGDPLLVAAIHAEHLYRAYPFEHQSPETALAVALSIAKARGVRITGELIPVLHAITRPTPRADHIALCLRVASSIAH